MNSIQSVTTTPNTNIQQANVNDDPTPTQNFKTDLQELEAVLNQLQKSPNLANDGRFQQKMEDVLQKFSDDYNALPDSVKQSAPVKDLILDLQDCGKEGNIGLIKIDQFSKSIEPIMTGELAGTLQDLVDPSHKVAWIPTMLDPSIEAAMKSLPA